MNLSKEAQKSTQSIKSYGKGIRLKNSTCRKSFNRDEDEIIIQEMGDEKMSNETVYKLAAKLNRNPASIRSRVKRLIVMNSNATKIENKRFTLQEDMFLLDEAVSDLKKCKILKAVDIEIDKIKTLSVRIGRASCSMHSRWRFRLKPWLLQYYNKTLNLEIRPMLTRIIADNFDNVGSIDWDSLSKFPELSGHNPESLVQTFSQTIGKIMDKFDVVSRTELTLPQIAEQTEKQFKDIPVRKLTEQRQQEVIKYFETAVKHNGITNFI